MSATMRRSGLATPTTYAKYVGRIGALAVALGVGAAVAGTPGVAWAEETSTSSDTGSSTSTKSAADNSDKGGPGTERKDRTPRRVTLRDAIEDTVDRATDSVRKTITGVTKNTSDAITSRPRLGVRPGGPDRVPTGRIETERKQSDPEPAEASQELSATIQRAGDARPATAEVPTRRALSQPGRGAPTPTRAVTDLRHGDPDTVVTHSVAPQQNSMSTVDHTPTVEVQGSSVPARAPLGVVTRVLSAALAPFLGAVNPGAPTPPNPVLWGVLAWVRRQVQETPLGKAVFNRSPEITTSDVGVVDNGNGTFTITPTGSDPDGDAVTYSVTGSGAGEGALSDNDDGTFTYSLSDPGTWDGSDTVTVTISDATTPHLHGFGGLFGSGGHTASAVVTITPSTGTLPPPPEIVQQPMPRDDGSGIYDTVLQYDADQIQTVQAAPGFEPTYWRVVGETYDPDTGRYTAELVPTQAGQLRAALNLSTKDELKLQVVEKPAVQTFALRSAAFAAIAAEDPPDQALQLPTPPAGTFVVAQEAIPVGSKPAGVIVTDKYAYILNSRIGGANSAEPSTVTVIGADPANAAEYNKVVGSIPVGVNPAFAGLVDDRLYVVNSSILSGSPSTITVIDTTNNSLIDADPNDGQTDIDAIELPNGAFVTMVRPDGKRIYVVNQQRDGNVYVVDTDETSSTYHQALDLDPHSDGIQGIPLGSQGTDDDTGVFTFANPLSGAFNADGSRLYIVRDVVTVTPVDGGATYVYNGELVVIDTATNTPVGQPISLGQYGGYAASDGDTLYVPTLDLDGYDPRDPNSPTPPGYVTVVDIGSDPDRPTVVDLDATTPEIDRIGVGRMPYNVVYSPDRSLAYVVSTGEGAVMVIDTATNKVIDLDSDTVGVQGLVYNTTPATSLNNQDASFIGISPDGNHLYVTNNKGDSVRALSFVTTP